MPIGLQIKELALRLQRTAWLKKEGTEIIEFAVSLPLLVVLVVGIYDFGSAFTLKHKLTSAVRDGARLAASQQFPPEANTLCGAPKAVCTVRDVVHSNLVAGNVDDCNLGSAVGSYSGLGSYTWTFNGTCAGLSLKIERNVLNPNTGSLIAPFDSSAYQVENTRITLVFPYDWQFNQAFKLLDRSANYLRSSITVSATMQNLE